MNEGICRFFLGGDGVADGGGVVVTLVVIWRGVIGWNGLARHVGRRARSGVGISGRRLCHSVSSLLMPSSFMLSTYHAL